jgi:hypothetical protein
LLFAALRARLVPGNSDFYFPHITQGLTIDSRVSEAAPPRIIQGKRVDDIVAFYEEYNAKQRNEL